MTTNNPQIQAIYVAPSAGAPMVAIQKAELIPGLGIKGDRYAHGIGAFSDNMPKKIRHLSLIAAAGIEIANEWLIVDQDHPFTAAETRRNIVVSNISPDDLNQLVGKQFFLGEVACKGVELCAPCMRPAELVGKFHFKDAFANRGGVRAEVLEPGEIKLGDILKL